MNNAADTLSREILHMCESLQQTLDDFGISGKVVGCATGPAAVRFEIALSPGVTFGSLKQIEDNISMNLEACSIRIPAPIPGRPVCDVEASLPERRMVQWRRITESPAWRDSSAELPLVIGETWNDEPVMVDLAKAPHLLIAGAPATGKSVCVNAIIASLISKFRADKLKLLFFDSKVIEYEVFDKLPHLAAPIIHDAREMAKALRKTAEEAARRYEQLSRHGVKNISEFNCDTAGHAPLHRLVIVIDTLSALMMTETKSEIETDIVRIAQRGHDVGIHLVIATAKPSTDIITDAINANMPTRLCFQVRSETDSRVVLDTADAKKLLGKGDMLLMRSTSATIERVQGALIPDADLTQLVNSISPRKGE